MNPINQLLTCGESALLNTGHADTFQILSGTAAGQTFQARLDIETVLEDGAGLLGADPRMQSVLRVLPSVPYAKQFVKNDVVQTTSDGKKWRILKMENNPTLVTIDFWVELQL